MLEIIQQHEDTRQGNDCVIKDCIVWLKCHDVHIVMNVRRYYGWCDNGMDFRCRKEFDEESKAYDYYHDMINNRYKY